jgi:hypothetical protein
MSNRFENPFEQMFGATARTSSTAGKLYFYLTGSSTPTNTYSDPDLAPGQSPTPTRSCSTAYGRHGAIFLDPAVTYKVVLKDSDGVTIATADPVVDPAANVTAAFQVNAGNPNGSVAGSAGHARRCSALRSSGTSPTTFSTSARRPAPRLTAVWTFRSQPTSAGAIVKSGIITPTALAANADTTIGRRRAARPLPPGACQGSARCGGDHRHQRQPGRRHGSADREHRDDLSDLILRTRARELDRCEPPDPQRRRGDPAERKPDASSTTRVRALAHPRRGEHRSAQRSRAAA